MQGQKGITLVALIITIVVMLILVAVTVSLVAETNLISTTQKAVNEYQAADDNLDDIANQNVYGGNSLQNYLEDASNANKKVSDNTEE